MLSAALPSLPREFAFSDDNFQRLRKLASQRAGLNLSESKRELVYGRLARRLRKLGLKDFNAYCELLDRGDPTELEAFTNALTTNLTYFFREPHHYAALREILAPEWLARNADNSARLNIWCAGCSTGEEPYSVALVTHEALGPAARRLRILATDLDSDVLATAQQGVYPLDRVEDIESARLKRWFLRGKGHRAGFARVSKALRDSIEFRQHNLVHQPPPNHTLFDAIFCRNVVIYFDREVQRQVYEKFADSLRPQGLLFVGHSESLFEKSDRFELIAQSTYRKRS